MVDIPLVLYICIVILLYFNKVNELAHSVNNHLVLSILCQLPRPTVGLTIYTYVNQPVSSLFFGVILLYEISSITMTWNFSVSIVSAR
jgi:hypothetical protein